MSVAFTAVRNREGRPGLGLRLAGALISVVLMAAALTACDAGAIIGDTLIGLQTTVDNIVAEASTEGNGILVTAGDEIQNVLDTVKSDVADLLDKGFNQVNNTVQHTLDQAKAMVVDLNGKVAAQLHSATQTAQQILNDLPFTNKNPQVTAYSPSYLASSQIVGNTVALDVTGNFVQAFEVGQSPTLSWGNSPTPLAAGVLTTQELTFYVPASLFRAGGSDLLPRVTFILQVPYQTGAIFKSIKPGEFRLTVTALPPPVRLLVLHNVILQTHTPQQPPLATQTLTVPSPAAHIASYDCQDKNVTLGPFTADNIPGQHWQINTASIQLIKSFPKGDQRQTVQLSGVTPNEFMVVVTTAASCFAGISSGSGDVYVQAQYTEFWQPPTPPATTTQTPTTEDLTTQLSWGGNVERGVTENQWSVNATMFDGTTKTFNSTDHSNPYVHVDYQQGSHSVDIQAVAPSDIMAKP